MSITELNSSGRLCQLLSVSHAALLRAIAELGIEPSVILDGLPRFDGAALEALRTYFADRPLSSGTRTIFGRPVSGPFGSGASPPMC